MQAKIIFGEQPLQVGAWKLPDLLSLDTCKTTYNPCVFWCVAFADGAHMQHNTR